MSALSLVTAVSVGLVLGLTGHLLIRRGRIVPLWLPPAAGVGAAVMAAVIARRANNERPAPTVAEVILEVLFAAAGVSLVAWTADRQPAGGRVTSHQRKGPMTMTGEYTAADSE